MAAVATGRTNPVVLATLAAAYAECGQFELAVGTQNEAINLVTDPLLKQSFSIRARLYETNTPYREN
jgi:hypothetical protein